MWDDDDLREARKGDKRPPDYLLRFGLGLMIAGFTQLAIEYTQNLLPSGLYFLLIPIGAVLLGLSCWRGTHRPVLTFVLIALPLVSLATFFAIAG